MVETEGCTRGGEAFSNEESNLFFPGREKQAGITAGENF